VEARDWSTYQGKVLRIELDGSIPSDNPVLNGVRSHVYSYGHRNPQGMVFLPDGRLYASEHGEGTDDEVNWIRAGRNYGWPFIAGFRDDQSYAYANWSASAPTPCTSLTFERRAPASVPRTRESDAALLNFTPPERTFFTVPDSFDLAVVGNASVAPGGVDVYTSDAIPGWRDSLLMATMISGVVLRVPLSEGSAAAPSIAYFKERNRYRDVAIAPDGRRIYVVTDPRGRTVGESGSLTAELEDPDAILEFTYVGPAVHDSHAP
jgi:PQQ-dependent dehydrogenase (s-GDH family)